MKSKLSFLTIVFLFLMSGHIQSLQAQAANQTLLPQSVRANIIGTTASLKAAPHTGNASADSAGSSARGDGEAESLPAVNGIERGEALPAAEASRPSADAASVSTQASSPARGAASPPRYATNVARMFLRRAAVSVGEADAGFAEPFETRAAVPHASALLSASSAACFRNDKEAWDAASTEPTFAATTTNLLIQDPPPPPPPPPPLIISEFRFRGPMGPLDEYIELYNNSTTPITVSTTDGSEGWALASLNPEENTPSIRFIIPNGTIIPPRTHYLAVNLHRYSLNAHAHRDVSYSNDIKDGAGIALFTTSDPLNFNSDYRADAVGFNTAPSSLFYEGTGLTPICPNDSQMRPNCGGGGIIEHAFYRNMSAGPPQDTGNNAADFVLVSVNASAINGVPSRLGAPGPSNSMSPTPRDIPGEFSSSLIDPSVPSSSSPNRVSNTDPYTDTLTPSSPNGTGGPYPGTLSIQRFFTNNTGQPVTKLRLRIVEVTTLNSPAIFANQADLRALTSNGQVKMTGGIVVATVKGTKVEQPPVQKMGGGWNTSLVVDLASLPTGRLEPGQGVPVQMLLGVAKGGSFRFFVNIEALTAAAPIGSAPTIFIGDPMDGSTFPEEDDITVSAYAEDSDGFVKHVEFYATSAAGQQIIGGDDTAPYSITWKNNAPGSYNLFAVAQDDKGNRTTSAIVQVTITPGPPPPGPVPGLGVCKLAKVVALDQVFFYNRLGALNPAGMIYALRRDVVPIDMSKGLVPGNVQLRPGKRARPLVLRMNKKDCLKIQFQNLLAEQPKDDNQPRTRTASIHVQGLQLVNDIRDDGSRVGQNAGSLVGPGGSATYTYYAEREGGYLLYSTAATTSGEGDGGTLAMGLFGAVNVEPEGAEYYRSQVTRAEMAEGTLRDPLGNPRRTATGQPLINYEARYQSGPFANLPIYKMTDGNEIVHSDLNAIITYANRQRFPAGTYPPVAVEPDREQPFREFTTIYHDEIKAVQAFDEFEDPVLSHTLHSVRDAFAINYGTGGIGAEILANRKMVGPMWNCTECLFEDFFLSSWAVADPAMIVDVPANVRDEKGNLITGPKATKAFFPDDPSNVHHSYLNDHTKFRVMHAGPKEHHIHHLHAHQWLHTPDAATSTMLDSQAIGPGSTFTTEIAHGGSGNLSKTVGDAIFHCHFYPHFAMGMWELWRVHDVFEEGTALDGNGRPAAGSRALPDAEIAAGTPIPAIVPIPTIPMAPVPTADFQGYPFYIPGVAGHRPPHPPLDTPFDGGLPRHVIVGGVAVSELNRLSFAKHVVEAVAHAVPEDGTLTEKRAMQFHAQPTHPSTTPENMPSVFPTNGRPPVAGAPFADPCPIVTEEGPVRHIRYDGAVFQMDVIFNKAGWHFPQQRINALWHDVQPTLDKLKAPEPLFFRANTNDCITYRHTNLTPNEYELDDFQVRTPTDIMGQHIHLVKFDVLASDGAGNGFNYEDGTFSPQEVEERIHAINARGGLQPPIGQPGVPMTLEVKPHPFFGTPGAQITIQRWFVDSVLDNEGNDRTHRTAFTHDHFGPSTHQQVGQYAGLILEPLNSTWRDPETGVQFRTRDDGGPTSWRADIITADPAESFREFLLEFADFQHAYKAGGGITPDGHPVPDPDDAINPPAKMEANFQPPFVLLEKMQQCPGTNEPPPCPEAIAAADVGTMVVNYRNEPIPLRIWNPNQSDPNYGTPVQAAGEAGDLANVYRSDITRADNRFNVQPTFYPPLTGGVQPGDPFTPLLRAYENDKVQIRILVGAHEEGHNFTVNGIKWLFEPSFDNSGWRNSQMMGISEHFEFIVPALPTPNQNTNVPVTGSATYDFRYAPGVAQDDQWNGLWGILRAYKGIVEVGNGDVGTGAPTTADSEDTPATGAPTTASSDAPLLPLPSNPDGRAGGGATGLNSALAPSTIGGPEVCPAGAPPKSFSVTAKLALDLLPEQTLVYNPRPNVGGRLEDPTAIMYVRTEDIDTATGKLKAGMKVEPLVLRANAGDCITLTLNNQISQVLDLPGHNTLPMIVDNFNFNQIKPSQKVGLHPQLLFYDVTKSDGMNVGFNQVQTANPGASVTYKWYAGDLTVDSQGTPVYTPIEFGATNLMPADPIKHSSKGAIGALIIEPSGSTVTEDAGTHSSAVITPLSGASYREFVLQFQDDINMRFGGRQDEWGNLKAVPNLAGEDDPEDTGQKAINYRTEPLWKRMGYEPDTDFEETRKFEFSNVLANGQVGGDDPVTPIFTATVGQYVRFRILQAGGHARNHVFQLHGHEWQEEPYVDGSRRIGNNPLSEMRGTQHGVGPSAHFDVDLRIGAGGRFLIRGDYLYRDRASFTFDGGMWGIFRVQ